ncbi:hypothetical protein WJX73_005190 [Symbiochloris irregularis]|uniref:ABC transporter domain-containing protein n=1 Tax=Symbiochloris irregularis TaxID=706552 RepID=A0AAW1P455_9CHLO
MKSDADKPPTPPASILNSNTHLLQSHQEDIPREPPTRQSFSTELPRERSHTITIGGEQDDDTEILEAVPHDKQIFLEYVQLNAWVPSAAPVGSSFIPGLPAISIPAPLKFWQKKPEPDAAPATPQSRQILYNIQGCCRPGEVLAFMGPSGSGKTSLLSIIGARAQSAMKRSGDCLFNGQPLTKKLKRQIGYVMQDDLFYESLTVWETLDYAAALRLPQHMSKQAKQKRVQMVITALGLEACKNTIIGGFFMKGISGGERKRASIGHEMLINPSVMLLDEPTSGLDSTSAMHLLQLLKKLSLSGRAIVTTIHQPSSRLFLQLDKLLLLSKGHALYYGPAQSCDDWFDRLGYKLPYRVNVADFILDLSSADVSREDRGGEESRMHLIACSENYQAHHPQDGYDPENTTAELAALRGSFRSHSKSRGKADQNQNQMNKGDLIDSAASLPGPRGKGDSTDSSSADRDVETGHVSAPNEAAAANTAAQAQEPGHVWGASYTAQLSILFRRSVRSRRNATLSFQDFALFLVIGVLAGLFWLQKCGNDTVGAAQNTLGLLFVEALFLSFRQMFVALFTFPDEYKMLLKERASGMYRLSAFYFARLASDLPLDFAIPTIFLIIVYFMGHLRYSAAAFFANYFTVILIMLVAQSYGLFLGTVVMNPKTAQTLAAIIMIVFMLTGGYFTRNIAVWISWFKYLSFIFYGYGLLAHIEFKDRQLYLCTTPNANPGAVQTFSDPPDPQNNPNCYPVPNTSEALGLPQQVNTHVWTPINACALVGMLILIRLFTYMALRHKTSQL